MKRGGMGGSCSKHEREEKFITHIWSENLKKRNKNFKDLWGRLEDNVNIYLKQYMGGCKAAFGLVHGRILWFCEHCHEPSASIKRRGNLLTR
jgi:hypothetical protein